MHVLGKTLIIVGLSIAVVGVFLYFFRGSHFPGRLPGDILIQKKNFTFYFPLATSLLLSAILSVLFYFINRR